jgi:Putative beta-barrel porin-2, OmpL-like. bbp2
LRYKLMCVSTCLLCCMAMSALGQDAPASPAPAGQAPAGQTTPAPAPAAAPAPPTWSIGPIDFSGVVDGYYSFNFNHPYPMSPPSSAILEGGNQLYNFDVNANQFSLNMVKFSLAHAPDPIGFEVDFGFGKAFEIVHAADASEVEHLEQAFVSWKPPKAKGFQVDFGEFVTSAGAEVIESYANWNYSRSILFGWAIPYYHFGARFTEPIGNHFTAGFQLVNGWNNIVDNNSGKTIGLSGNFASKKVSWNNVYYAGPENPGTNKGWRNLYDTVLLLTPADKFNAYVNFDYGQNKIVLDDGTSTTPAWYGIALAAHLGVTGKSSFTPRYEWFKDRDGFSTGTAQTLQEFTLTYEYKWVEGLLSRLEYRHDWSNADFFNRGMTPAASKNQDTLTIAFVGYFGPKR